MPGVWRAPGSLGNKVLRARRRFTRDNPTPVAREASGWRGLPEPHRRMDSAPRDFCGEAFARCRRVAYVPEKWRASQAGHREESRARYPPLTREATGVAVSAFRKG